MLGNRDAALTALEERLKVRFKNRSLLEEALTHPSYANERHATRHNQRLEFLGDSVVEMVVSHQLYLRYPNAPEGQLTRTRAHLVSAPTMARIGYHLELNNLILLGRGELRSGGQRRDSIIADAVEALIGAVYLDQPWEVTYDLVLRLWEPWFERLGTNTALLDPKSELQEWLQGHGGCTPEYRLKDSYGPDHARTFIVEVLHRGEVLAVGTGRSKKEAEQDAARKALDALPRVGAGVSHGDE